MIATTYPCCGGAARIAATPGLPSEIVDRRCPTCETRYEVHRRTLERGGIRVDILDWLDTRTRLFTRQYGQQGR